MNSPVKWIGVQVIVCLLAVVWTYSRRSGPVIPQVTETRLSPLEFVNTLGALYHRAGGAAIAVDESYRRFRTALAKRLGVSSDTSDAVLAQAAARRFRIDGPALESALDACVRTRETATLDPRHALSVVRSLSAQSVALRLFHAAGAEKH